MKTFGTSLHREPTPPEIFFNRRAFVKTSAAVSLLGIPAACGQDGSSGPNPRVIAPRAWPVGFSAARNEAILFPDAITRRKITERLVAGSHNNFYEFLPGRGGDVWPKTRAFKVDPWSVEITGECNKPMTLDLEELDAFAHEERLYHFRCVERWAMNVPWIGFPLRTLLEKVEPNGHAQYVRFVSANQPQQMPGLAGTGDQYPWPYHEALRIDEAMHELAMVVTGVYGEPLTKQHGAPVRIIVPWKYGYKNPKSIVRIELIREQPQTFWAMPTYAHEYGFLSNVNPNLPHPRWSQARSYWLDSREMFDTPIFNGYGEHVAGLYPDEPTTPQPALKRGGVAR